MSACTVFVNACTVLRHGLPVWWSLFRTFVFNLMCIPPIGRAASFLSGLQLASVGMIGKKNEFSRIEFSPL